MKISLIIPVFNEEEAIPIFYETVKNNQELKNYELELLFINDGSKDKTLEVLKNIRKQDNSVIILDFSRNFGKEPALFAGLEHATGEAVIPIDEVLR